MKYSPSICIFLIAFSLCLDPSWANSSELRVLELEAQYYNQEGVLFRYDDGVFIFEGLLTPDKTLLLDVELIRSFDGVRSSVRGKDLYKEMIGYFGVDNIDMIIGDWWSGTNFQTYMTYREEGASKEQAAFATWSGRMARSFGFTKIQEVKENDIENLSRQRSVVVKFVKPTPSCNESLNPQY